MDACTGILVPVYRSRIQQLLIHPHITGAPFYAPPIEYRGVSLRTTNEASFVRISFVDTFYLRKVALSKHALTEALRALHHVSEAQRVREQFRYICTMSEMWYVISRVRLHRSGQGFTVLVSYLYILRLLSAKRRGLYKVWCIPPRPPKATAMS